MKDPKIIRIGDEVKVIRPFTFVRCGYPMCIPDEAEKIEEAHGEAINEFLVKMGVKRYGRHFLSDGDNQEFCQARTNIAFALARALTYQIGFGGDKREVYEQEDAHLLDKEGEVEEIFYVKTGTRFAGHWYTSLDGDEYDPPYLDGIKTHKVLVVRFRNWFPATILASNVEKLRSADPAKLKPMKYKLG